MPTVEDLDRSRMLLAEWIASRLEPMHGDILSAVSQSAADQMPVGESLGQVQIDVLSFVAEEVAALRDAMGAIGEDAASARAEAQAAHAQAALTTRLVQEQPGSIDGERLAAVTLRGELDAIDGQVAALLNAVDSTTGPARTANWFINHPETIVYAPGRVELAAVNERIVENPFVFAAVSQLAPGSRVLDVGAAESTVALSFASLGFETVALDPRGYPFEHDLLTEAKIPLAEYDGPPFDAVVALSTIEHLGLPAYDVSGELDEHADRDALAKIHQLLVPGGLLVLTVPYGQAAMTDFERIYDEDGLQTLLSPFSEPRIEYAHRHSSTEWRGTRDPAKPGCALIVARKDA